MANTPTTAERIAISRAIRILQVFRSIDPDITINAARSFLLVASQGSMPMGELHQKGEFLPSSATRYAGYLGKEDRHHTPGLNLVASRQNPKDHRRKALRLTVSGETLARQLHEIFKPLSED